MDIQICAEVAEQEFERFLGIWDINGDTSGMTEEDLASFEPIKKRIIEGIKRGAVTIGESGEFLYTLREPRGELDTLELKVQRANLLVMDSYKDKQTMHKLNAYIGSLAGQPPKTISGLDPRDQKTVRGVALLFLGS